MTRHSLTLFRIFLLLIAAGLITFSIPLIQKESTQEIFADIEQSDFSGVVLIADGDTALHKQSFGFSSCDKREKTSQESVFAIGSITKMFTAAAIGQLEANGKLNIDDGIDQYLTGIPEDKTSITIKQLLEHTSGLDAYHETGELGDFEPMTRAKAFNEIMNRPLLFTPRSRSEYSNSGYTLLALLIEEVSGEQYTTYIRNHLLIPSKMTSTGFWGEAFETIASTPNTHSGCSPPDHWDYSWVLVGNGGMVSTVGDLHRWISALKGSSVLGENAKKRIGFDKLFKNGFGDAGGSSQHEFNASIEYDAQHDITVAAISNSSALLAENIGTRLLRAAIRERQLKSGNSESK